ASHSLPPIHRRAESHLARRFHALCYAAMKEVTGVADLEPIEYGSLSSVHDAPGIDEQLLAERMGLDLATARRIAKRLERRGFIESSPKADSGRLHTLGVTPMGGEIIQRLRPAIRAAHDRIMTPLSDRERERRLVLLRR